MRDETQLSNEPEFQRKLEERLVAAKEVGTRVRRHQIEPYARVAEDEPQATARRDQQPGAECRSELHG